MNALAESIQDDDLRFSPGLFLSGLKIHKLNGIQIDRKKCIVDRSRQLSYVSRFVPQEFVEGTQKPQVVDSEMNAPPLGHDSLLSLRWGCRDWRHVAAHTYRYIHHPHRSFKPPPQFRKSVRMSNRDMSNRDLPNLPALVHGPYYLRICRKQVNPIHRALPRLPRSRRSIGRRASKDGRTLGETGPNSRLSFFQTLELPRIGAGSLDAFSCKFNLPSVPLKTGGIGKNISGNGFSLVGLI